MALLNILRGTCLVQAYFEYDTKHDVICFDADIILGDWRVSKRIPDSYNRQYLSHYDDYVEFVIIDKHGESRIWKFNYNNTFPDMPDASNYDYGGVQRGVRRFLENHPLFDCDDWKDYESSFILSKIHDVVKSDKSNYEKLTEIRRIVQNPTPNC
jgi:hypothetical protein